jgi:uncharacterized membrane protein YgcG
VGYLIDGRLKPPHVLGALFNLAREGYLTISANAADDAQIGQLTLQRTGRNIDHLSPFDTVLLAKLFGTTREISLVKNYRALHRVLPKLERIVEADLFQEELLDRQLALTRHTWRALGRISPFVIVAAALIGFLLAIFILPRFMFVTDAIRTLVVVAAIVIGIIFVVSRGILAGRLQPLTERGIAERNTWLAYKEYLKRPDALRAFDLKRFEQLFPIAVTMGLDSTYLDQFTTAEGIDLPAWVSLSGAVTLAAVGTTITQMMTGLNAWLRPPVVMSTSSSTYYDQTHWSTSAGSAWSSSSNFSSDSGGSSGGDSGSSGGGDSSFG